MATRFISTAAVEEMDCPKCGQTKGNYCRTPKGRLCTMTHGERIQAYQSSISHEEFMRRHSGRSYSALEIIGG